MFGVLSKIGGTIHQPAKPTNLVEKLDKDNQEIVDVVAHTAQEVVLQQSTEFAVSAPPK